MRVLMICLLTVLAASPFWPFKDKDNKQARTAFILAISWQPAFCETSSKTSECRTQSSGRFDASHFTLHGLWIVGKTYCDVLPGIRQIDERGDWRRLPPVAMSDETRQKIDQAMPGSQSYLDRHEWIKHGTCTGLQANDYFETALRYLDAVNQSAVRDVFAQNIGRTVTADTIRAAFDKNFGESAGDRVKIACRKVNGRQLITELTIGLSREALSPQAQVSDLIGDARPTAAGCASGLVDAVGYNR